MNAKVGIYADSHRFRQSSIEKACRLFPITFLTFPLATLAVSTVYALLAKISKQQEVVLLTSDVLHEREASELGDISGDCIFIGGTKLATATVSKLSPNLLQYMETGEGYEYVIGSRQQVKFRPRDLSFLVYKSKTSPHGTVIWLFSPFAVGCAEAAVFLNENVWRLVREKQDEEFLEVYKVTRGDPAYVRMYPGWRNSGDSLLISVVN